MPPLGFCGLEAARRILVMPPSNEIRSLWEQRRDEFVISDDDRHLPIVEEAAQHAECDELPLERRQ
jgi:hypothetical protein